MLKSGTPGENRTYEIPSYGRAAAVSRLPGASSLPALFQADPVPESAVADEESGINVHSRDRNRAQHGDISATQKVTLALNMS